MTPLGTFRRSARDNTGASLVELIIYIAITAAGLAVIASVFASSLHAEATTRERDHATGSAQVVANSIQTSIRNSACSPSSLAAGTCSGGFSIVDNLLRARVAIDGGWECRAWDIVSVDGHDTLVYTRSDDPIPASVNRATWSRLAVDVAGTLDESGTAFADAGGVLVLGFTIGTEDAQSAVRGRAVALAKQDADTAGGPSTCWD